MLTDLVQIRRLGEQNREENQRFRKWIKSHKFVERQFRRVAEEVHDAIDCRQCAECCRVTEVELHDRDLESLPHHLRLTQKQFKAQYTATGSDGELILRRTESGCVFLDGNDCTIYEFRPKTCEDFPHVQRGMGSIPSRMWVLIDRATFCPIVYNWMEKVKDLTNFRQ